MTRAEIEDKITAIVEPLLLDLPIELVDVEFVQEREWYLRIFIDKPEGIGIDDCEQLSRALEPILDEIDFIKQAYYLEVSSPDWIGFYVEIRILCGMPANWWM